MVTFKGLDHVTFASQLTDRQQSFGLEAPCHRAPPSVCWTSGVSAVNPVVLDLDGQSSVVPVPACRLSAVPKVVELCSGLGAFTSVLPRVSMTAAAGVAPCTSWG